MIFWNALFIMLRWVVVSNHAPHLQASRSHYGQAGIGVTYTT